MILSAEQLALLKKAQLEMLKHFLTICQVLDLKYYLIEGTLLGAVRHNGFIPWDDDIDVAMPRKDYEIFLQKAPALLPPHLFLQNLHSDPYFPANFSKIRNNNTTYIETSVKDFPIHHGVFVDVFPLDIYPDNRFSKLLFKYKNKFLSRIISSYFFYSNPNRPLHTKWVDKLVRILHLSPRKAVQKREHLYRSFSNGSMLGSFCGAWGEKEITPASWFGDGADLEFEGLKVKGPVCYHEWLTQVYGDYMQLPPVEKRIGHHYAEAVDLTQPYTAYIKK